MMSLGEWSSINFQKFYKAISSLVCFEELGRSSSFLEDKNINKLIHSSLNQNKVQPPHDDADWLAEPGSWSSRPLPVLVLRILTAATSLRAISPASTFDTILLVNLVKAWTILAPVTADVSTNKHSTIVLTANLSYRSLERTQPCQASLFVSLPVAGHTYFQWLGKWPLAALISALLRAIS